MAQTNTNNTSLKSPGKALALVLGLAAMAFALMAPFASAQDIIPVVDNLLAQADTEAPSDVENVAAAAGNGQVKLTWNVATDNELVKGYRIYYGTSPVINDGDSYALGPIDAGNKITYTVTGLQNGTTYYFAVTAYDDAGNESESYSAEVSATPAHAAADTEAPRVISAEATNRSTVKVRFSEPVGLPAVDPELAFSIKDDVSQIGLEVMNAQMDEDDATGKTVVLTTALQQAGATYILTAGIQIKDAAGNPIVSGTSDTALFTGTDIEPAPIVTQETIASADTTGPEFVNVLSTDSTHVVVVFNEPLMLAADPVTNFYITEVDNTDNSLDIVSATLSADKKTVTLLTKPMMAMGYNLIALDVKDLAGNDMDVANNATSFDGKGAIPPAGTQETMATQTQETVETTAPVDTIPPEDVTNFVAKMLKQMVVTLTWTASANSVGDLADYVLYKSTDGVTFGEGVVLNAAASTYDALGLVPGMKYFFKLTARDTTGNESAGVVAMFELPKTGPELLFLLGASFGVGKFLKRRKVAKSSRK